MMAMMTMRRGLAMRGRSGRGAVQALVLALWALCAVAAVASPTRRPVKSHAVKTTRAAKAAGTKTARAKAKKPAGKTRGKATLKSAPKTKAQRRKLKADDMEFDPPAVHRARTKAVEAKQPGAAVSQGLPAMPPTNTKYAAPPAAYVAPAGAPPMAAVSAEHALPAAYSPVGDDDAPEFVDTTPAPPVVTAPERALLQPLTKQELAEEAVQPMVMPGLYSRTGRLLMPAALKGSREVLVHQNVMADAAGLDRIQDDEDLARLRRLRLLVEFPVSASLRVNPALNVDRRCARPWTVKFAVDVARQFSARFHQPLQVNSAVRTVAYQRRLQRTNGNAAAVDGEGASPHLTGQAIDFGKRGMTLAEIAWMRAYLLPLMRAGKVDVEEEFQQACFHISVYKSYVPATRKVVPKNQVAQVRVPRVGRGGE